MAVKGGQLGDNADTILLLYNNTYIFCCFWFFSSNISKIRTEDSVCEKYTISYLKFKVNRIEYITDTFLEEGIIHFFW